MQIRKAIINTKLNIHRKHFKASCSLILPCAPHFQLANPRCNLLARLLISCEGSYSVPPLLPSFGQPVISPCSLCSCFLPVTVTSSPPERGPLLAPSQPAIKPSSAPFFSPLPSKRSLRRLQSTPLAAWVFSKRHV